MENAVFTRGQSNQRRRVAATGHRPGLLGAIVLAASLLLGPAGLGTRTASAQLNVEPKQLEGVGTADKRGERVNPDLVFTGHDGKAFRIGEYFDGKRPVILLLAYYDCPLLCNLMIDSVREALKTDRLRIGRDIHLVVVSIDHTNTQAMATSKRQEFLARYVHQDLSEKEKRSLVFVISEPGPVRELANTVGYYYRYLPVEQEFAHPPAIYFLTPDGVVSTMLLGVNTPARQVELALNEASNGRTASFIDTIAFSCFMFNPATGQYVISPMNVMRLGASTVAVLLFAMIGMFFLRSWLTGRRDRAAQAVQPDGDPAGARTLAAESTGRVTPAQH